MLIDNDVLAVGTAASGAATANVIYQHRKGINEHILKPAWNIIKMPFQYDTYTKIGEKGSKVKNFYENNGFKETFHKAGHTVKVKVSNYANSVWNITKKAWNAFKRTDWGKAGKVAGVVTVAAGVAFVAKSVFDAIEGGKNY